jgi:UPF0042 nucleotide-binding protein
MVQAESGAGGALGPHQLLVVSGLSGSGKTVALRSLEDLGYFCIDNLPAALLQAFVEQTLGPDSGYGKVAVGVDARSPLADLDALPRTLSNLAEMGFAGCLLYLEASDEVLVKRFSETRRRHPLSCTGVSLQEAIARERQVLKPLRLIADFTIDTTSLNVHELRRQVALTVGVVPGKLMLMLESFAFKNGVPSDADFVFDARFLPNPHWDARLRPLSGRDTAVRQYFAEHGMVLDFLADIARFLDRWLPAFDVGERSYLTVAIGCTGGRHRSVYLVEALAERFRASHGDVLVYHREMR